MDKTVRALTDLAAVDDQLSGGEALIDGLVPALEERRAALREAIPGAFLAAYDALGRVGRRPVVVPVRGAHCGGCYLRLPAQLDSSIRRRQSLCSCPHCGRLLYSSPSGEESERASELKHKLGDRRARNGRASKRVGQIPGRRPDLQEPTLPKDDSRAAEMSCSTMRGAGRPRHVYMAGAAASRPDLGAEPVSPSTARERKAHSGGKATRAPGRLIARRRGPG